MIYENDLYEAIAECEGQRNPNASTCMKLAAYYTILDHIKPEPEQETRNILPVFSGYSRESRYDSGTEFSDAISGLDMDSVLPIIDELMTAIKVLHPRLYEATLTKIGDL